MAARKWFHAWKQRRIASAARNKQPLTLAQQRRRRILVGTAAAGGIGVAILSFLGMRPRPTPQIGRPTPSIPTQIRPSVVLEFPHDPTVRVHVPRLPGETSQEYQQRLQRERTRTNGERPSPRNGTGTRPEPYRQRAPARQPVYETEESLRYIAREKAALLARTDLANPTWTPQSGGNLAENIPPGGGLVQVQVTYNDPITQLPVTKQSFLFAENTERGIRIQQFGPLTNDPQFQVDKSLGWKAMSGDLDYWLNQNQGVNPQVLGLYTPQ